jgi:hypothetical protein
LIGGWTWRDIGERAFAERRPDAVGIIGLIGQQYRSRTNMVQQAVSSLAVMALPSGQAQSDRKTLPIDDRVDFGRVRLGNDRDNDLDPFAVAAC